MSTALHIIHNIFAIAKLMLYTCYDAHIVASYEVDKFKKTYFSICYWYIYNAVYIKEQHQQHACIYQYSLCERLAFIVKDYNFLVVTVSLIFLVTRFILCPSICCTRMCSRRFYWTQSWVLNVLCNNML